MFDDIKFRNLKLGQKLVFLLLIVGVIPLLAISVSNYYYAKAELEKKTIDALQAINNSRAAHINHSIQLRQEQAKEIAGAYLPKELQGSGVNSPEIIRAIQQDLDSTFRDLKSTPSSGYKDIDKATDIEIIGVWDVYGTIIANTRKELIGKKMPVEYLQNVYDQGTYFGGLERDPLTGENFIIILEEIRNWKSKLFVGAVSLKIQANILNEITTAREGLGSSGETYVVDNLYRMVTQSRFNKDSTLKVRVITEGTQACFYGQKAPTIYKNYRDVNVLGTQKYLPDQDWCLVSEIEAEEAFAPVKTLRDRTLFIGGFLISVILIFAYMASRTFIRPILKLHDASQEVAKGNYQFEVSVKNKDEIGELTRAFNAMTKSLSNITLELEKKNKDLFKNLAISTRQKKELKDVNQELDSFVYTASHDLRAPLRGIASFAAFLEDDYKNKLNDQGKDYINEIRKGASKMDALIQDLLALSRISRIKNPYENVSINGLIDSVLERIKFDIKNHNVDIQIQKDMPTVYCDRIKMSEVFLNLINNAIKFSVKHQKNRPKVEVGYVSEKEFHKFFVKDNGIGIDPKYHDQVFGIFKRLHTDKEYEGTGAGLSIVKRVIHDHQGQIWIESELGKGAAFYFTIPKQLKTQEKSDEAIIQEDLSNQEGTT